MIDLMKYFRILFLSARISRERLKIFAESHLQRLTANNPGNIFAPLIAALQIALDDYNKDVVDISTVGAQLKSLTQSANDAQAAVLNKIRELEPYITYTYRNDRPVYLQFYPSGLEEYNQATQAVFETLSKRFGNTLSVHSADFPPTEITGYDSLLVDLLKKRANLLNLQGTEDGERSEITDTRTKLAQQLTVNLLTIALNFPGNETKAAVYFDQSILDAAFAENTSAEGDLNAAETQNCFSNTKKPDTQYRIKLNSEGTVRIAFKTGVEDAVTATEGQEIQSGTDWILVTASAIGYSSTNKFLNITNTGSITTSFIIERV